MFNKSDYLKSQAWLEDEYLVHPDGTKLCKLCNELQYIVEFINYGEYVDGKLPVCISCLRVKRRAILARDMINKSGFTVKCVKCEGEKRLGQMSFNYTDNEVRNICIDCKKKGIKKAWG